MDNPKHGNDDKNIARRSVKAAGWVMVVQFTDQFSHLILGIVLARLLSPDDFGIIGMIAIFWAISRVFINGGFAEALIQRKTITDTELCSVFYYNVFLSLLCCGLMIFFAPVIAKCYGQPILSRTICVSAWALPVAALTSIQRVLLSRQLKQFYVTISTLISYLLSIAIAILIAWKGGGVWALVWQKFLATVFSSFFIFAVVRWIPRYRFSLKALGSLFGYGSKLMIASLLDAVFGNLDSALIGKFYKADTLGFYKRADLYARLWPTSVQATISKVLFPAFSKIQDDLPRLHAAFRRSLAVSVFVIILPAFLLCALSRPFIHLVLTDRWLPCLTYWWLITCTVIFWPLQVLNLQLLKARGRSGLNLILEVIKKVLILIKLGTLFLWGIVPMLCVGIGFSIFCAYINSYYTGKTLKFGLGSQLRVMLPYVLISAVSCLIARGAYIVITPLSEWCGFLIPAFIGVVVYLVLNRVFRTAAFLDLAGMTRAKAPWVCRLLLL